MSREDWYRIERIDSIADRLKASFKYIDEYLHRGRVSLSRSFFVDAARAFRAPVIEERTPGACPRTDIVFCFILSA